MKLTLHHVETKSEWVVCMVVSDRLDSGAQSWKDFVFKR